MDNKPKRHAKVLCCLISPQHFLMIVGAVVALELMGLYYLTNLHIWWDNHVTTPLAKWGNETLKVIAFFFSGLEILHLMLCGKCFRCHKTKSLLIIGGGMATLFYVLQRVDNPFLQRWGQVFMIDFTIMFVGFSLLRNRSSILLDIATTSWAMVVGLKRELFPSLTPDKGKAEIAHRTTNFS